jgi:hypothetical protein
MMKDAETCKKATADNPCKYGFVDAKSEIWTDYSAPCHASLARYGDDWNGNKGRKPVALYNFSAMNDINRSEAALAFFDWITGDTHPWAKVLGLTDPFEIDGIDINTNDFRRQFGWFFPDLTLFTGNVLANFLFATRLHIERTECTDLWHKLVRDGADPTLAFMWANLLFTRWDRPRVVEGFYRFTAFDAGHSAVDASNVTTGAVVNFYAGTPGRNVDVGPEAVNSYAKKRSYYPANTIWHDNSRSKYKTFIQKQYEDILTAPADPEAKRPVFVKAQATDMSYETVLKIIKLEMKRLDAVQAKKKAA